MPKIQVNPLFIVLVLLMIALGSIEQFFILILSISLHEFGHVLVALFFRLSISGIKFLPLGQVAVISKTEELSAFQRVLLAVAGPLVNGLLALVFFLFKGSSPQWVFSNGIDLDYIVMLNLVLLLFNLLPIYPLDGGRLLQIFLYRSTSVVKANKQIITVGKACSYGLMALGLVQVALYPFNISLYCIGFYILKSLDTEYVHLTMEFYRILFTRKQKKILPAKIIAVPSGTKLLTLLNQMNTDKYLCVYLTDKERFVGQNTIINQINKLGLNGNLDHDMEF